MTSLRNLKKRIRLVKNIAKVTKAMEVAAALKMKRAQDAAINSRLFAKKLGEIASLVARENPTVPDSQIDLILVAPDRGLCGSLLSNLQKGLNIFVNQVGRDRIRLICVNKRAVIIANHLGLNIVGVFDLHVSKPDSLQMNSIIKIINDDFSQGIAGLCLVGFAHYQSLMVQTFATQQILPFEIEPSATVNQQILIEPNQHELYQSLIPRSLRLKLFQAILETSASEFSARAMSMKSASDNASEIFNLLTSKYNQSRQSAITSQIAEVIGAGLSSE